MTIEFTGRKIEITPALKSFSEQKLKKLSRVIDGIIEAHVILTVEKHRQSAEIIVHSAHATLTGSETTDDLYKSIGQVLAKLEKQAIKLKGRYFSGKKRGKGGKSIRGGREIGDEMPVLTRAATAADGGPRVIRSRRYAVKPMSVDEALLQAQGSKDTFLVFRDARSQRVSVLYRRPDGNYGLIEPEI
jgi:putative sigma-54 modulation protein